MSWHAPTRSAVPLNLVGGGVWEPTTVPLDLEYRQALKSRWWRAERRLGQLERPETTIQPLKLPMLQPVMQPHYKGWQPRTDVLRDHIYTTRQFNHSAGRMAVPAATMAGDVECRSAREKLHLLRDSPRTTGIGHDQNWAQSTTQLPTWPVSVSGYFGPPH